MTWGSVLDAIRAALPLPFARKPEDDEEHRKNREAIERARRAIDTWNERHRDTWRQDGHHHASMG